MLNFFKSTSGEVYLQTKKGIFFRFKGVTLNADRLIDFFEREQFGGRFMIDDQWEIPQRTCQCGSGQIVMDCTNWDYRKVNFCG
jgi:hypothetical protein